MPVFPGQLRQIRKNLFHAVFVIDPAMSCGLEASLFSQACQLLFVFPSEIPHYMAYCMEPCSPLIRSYHCMRKILL